MSKTSLSAGLAARRAAEQQEFNDSVQRAMAYLGVSEARARQIVLNVNSGSPAGVRRWIEYVAGRDAELAEQASRWNEEWERECEAAMAARKAAPKPMTRAERDAKLGELDAAYRAAKAAGDRDLARSISREMDEIELA